MKTETPKTLLILGLTVLLCIAFDDKSSAYGLAEIKSENTCFSKFFETLSCSRNNEIRVINALFGYSFCDSVDGQCCAVPENDCFLSIPIYNFDYYQTIIESCSNKVRCLPYANATDVDVFCHEDIQQQSDYVRLEYNCVPSSKTMITQTICRNSSTFPMSTTLSCAENESIAFVGAILGFQDSEEESCRPGEDRCRMQPDASHINCIQTVCHGQQTCTVYAAESAPANDTCSKFAYKYQNITYYCDDVERASPVSPVDASCWSSSSTTTVTTTKSTSTSLTSTLALNTSAEVSLATSTTSTTVDPGAEVSLATSIASTTVEPGAEVSLATSFTSTTAEPGAEVSLATSIASTTVKPGAEVSLATSIDTTTAEPAEEGEGDDNLDVIIGVSIACALVITAVIAGVTAAMVYRKRKLSGASHHGYLGQDSESPTPSVEVYQDVASYYNNPPQTKSPQPGGGQNGNQGPSNGDVISPNIADKVYRENRGLPNGRMDTNSDNRKSTTNPEDDYSDASMVKLTGAKAMRW